MTVNAWVQQLIQPDDHLMPNFTKFDNSHYWEPADTLAWPMPERERDREDDDDDKEEKGKGKEKKEETVGKVAGVAGETKE